MITWFLGGSVVAMLALMVPVWIAGHLHRREMEVQPPGRKPRWRSSAVSGMSAGPLRAVFLGWTLLIALLLIWAFTGAEGDPGVALGVVLVFASAVPGALAAVLTNYMFAVARGRA